jgi:hypothetical protein
MRQARKVLLLGLALALAGGAAFAQQVDFSRYVALGATAEPKLIAVPDFADKTNVKEWRDAGAGLAGAAAFVRGDRC